MSSNSGLIIVGALIIYVGLMFNACSAKDQATDLSGIENGLHSISLSLTAIEGSLDNIGSTLMAVDTTIGNKNCNIIQ